MPEEKQERQPFAIKDCALIALATGKRAQNIREVHDLLSSISRDSIYYHFWGGRLRPGFGNPDFHNDFATWAFEALHDSILAERLSILNPTDHQSLEDLRRELLEVMEERLDEVDYPTWARRDQQFEFLRSQIVVFDTHHVISEPKDMKKLVPHLSLGSIFYHFIDARRRNPDSVDDFRNWLTGFAGYEELEKAIAGIDPYFSTLDEMRVQLSEIIAAFLE